MARRKTRQIIMCVYCLIINNKRYVGSTIDYNYRMKDHLKKLRKKKHGNRYLQRAFNKYGENGLKIEIIELIYDEIILRIKENEWIKFYNATNNKYGYNCGEVTNIGGVRFKWTKSQKKKHYRRIEKQCAKTYIFYNPNGKKVKIFNLAKYCRKHKLDYDNMIAVWLDRQPDHKGWKKDLERKNKCFKTITLINPEEKEIEVTNIRGFCKINNLDHQTIHNLSKGKGFQHKGWKVKGGKRPKIYKFLSPEGDLIETNSMQKLCIEFGLHSGSMSEVSNGKRRSCKGWINPDIIWDVGHNQKLTKLE